MRTAFGILARDVKLLLRNPVALIVVGALLVLPGLYAWYCIIANWDPYSHTGNVPVAVVNNDAGAKSDLTGEVNIGEQVVEQLREDDNIAWYFVENEAQALEDTRIGDYYATIVLPETLSQDVVGIFDGSPNVPTIYYYPNEKFNAVATKVTDSAALTLVRQVNQAFSSQVNATILQAVQKGADSAQDSAEKSYEGTLATVKRVQGDISEAVGALDDATSSIEAWRVAAAGGQETLSGVSSQLPAIRTALTDASGDLSNLRQKTAEFDQSFSKTLLQSTQVLSTMSAHTSASIANASADVRQLAGGVDATVEQLRGFRELVDAIIELIDDEEVKAELTALVDEIDTTLANLEEASDGLSSLAKQTGERAAQTNESIQKATDDAAAASDTFSRQIMPKLSTGTDELARSMSGLSGAVSQFEPQVTQLQNVLTQTDAALVRALDSAAQAKQLLQGVSDDLSSTVTDLGSLGSALEVEQISELLNVSPDNVGQFVSSPVQMVTEKVYPVSNYGTAVAPFYTNLALWIGCFILISIIRLEVDRRGFETATTTQRYFGRWLLLIILALLQSQVICGVDILLGIDCANPAIFMLSGAVASFCYMNLIYALALTFRNIGKTLCILLLIMQVPGSSGMYPIEMMPGFFQAIHPVLPFTYGIEAMREALCGLYGTVCFGDMLVLASLVPASLLLGLVLRPYLLNLTQLFDAELGKTGFFAAEEHGQGRDSDLMRRMMRSLARHDSFRDEIEQRAWAFNRRYPRLRRVGSIALFVIPFAFLAIILPFNLTHDMDVDVKLNSLVIILIVLLVVQIGLIVLEYMHQTIATETRLLGMEIMDDYATVVDQADDARQMVQGYADEMRAEVRGAVEQRAEEMREATRAYLEETVKSREASTTAALPLVIPDLPKPAGKHARDTRKRRGAAREIFFTDLRLGMQSVIGIVVILLLVLTPSLYAWFNIAGSWDPYSNTDGLRVAVANEDEGYKGDLLPLTVNVGDTVVSQLRGNQSFDWQFVSEEEAVEGIRAGEYYASIVIPADFSRNMMTYLTDDAGYPDVIYYTNEKENPIAPLITQKGADSIQENIRTTFTERVDEAGLTMASDLLEYLTQPRVTDYAKKMGGHLDDAVSDMQSGSSEMRSLADLSTIVSDVVQTAGVAMDGITDAAKVGKNSLADAEKGISTAGDAFAQASALVENLVSQGSGSLDDLAADADGALAALQEGAADAPEKLWNVEERLARWKSQVVDIRDLLLEEAKDPELPDDTRRELEEAAEDLQPIIDALEKMRAALEQAATDSEGSAESIQTTRNELKALFAEAKSGSSELKAFFDSDVKGAVSDLKETMDTVSGSMNAILSGLGDTIEGLSSSTSGLSGQLTSLSSGLGEGADQLDSAALSLANAKMRVNEAVDSKDVKQLQRLLLGSDTGVLAARLAAPVQEKEEAIFPVANYGSSMAPFYTVLSLWVGALVMVSTMKAHLTPERVEELRRRFRLKPRHEYLGRLGIFAFISLLQALLVSLGDLFLLHIQCVHPVLFVLECIYIGQVFNLIVFTFTELFGDVGKAVCIILLIMQVAASGGTFPVEMLGEHFMMIVPFLPFYHGMTALQGCVAGIYYGDSFVYLLFLFAFVVGMFLMGLVARKPFRFVTNWVEEQLEKTGYL